MITLIAALVPCAKSGFSTDGEVERYWRIRASEMGIIGYFSE